VSLPFDGIIKEVHINLKNVLWHLFGMSHSDMKKKKKRRRRRRGEENMRTLIIHMMMIINYSNIFVCL
jgi:hypothetical protein